MIVRMDRATADASCSYDTVASNTGGPSGSNSSVTLVMATCTELGVRMSHHFQYPGSWAQSTRWTASVGWASAIAARAISARASPIYEARMFTSLPRAEMVAAIQPTASNSPEIRKSLLLVGSMPSLFHGGLSDGLERWLVFGRFWWRSIWFSDGRRVEVVGVGLWLVDVFM